MLILMSACRGDKAGKEAKDRKTRERERRERARGGRRGGAKREAVALLRIHDASLMYLKDTFGSEASHFDALIHTKPQEERGSAPQVGDDYDEF